MATSVPSLPYHLSAPAVLLGASAHYVLSLWQISQDRSALYHLERAANVVVTGVDDAGFGGLGFGALLRVRKKTFIQYGVKVQ